MHIAVRNIHYVSTARQLVCVSLDSALCALFHALTTTMDSLPIRSRWKKRKIKKGEEEESENIQALVLCYYVTPGKGELLLL